MDKSEILKMIEEIKKEAGKEDAHMLEDYLYLLFIKSVADGYYGKLSDLAKLVLTTKEIKFTRWYA